MAVAATTLALLAPVATAEPSGPSGSSALTSAAGGRGVTPDQSAARPSTAAAAKLAAAAESFGEPITMPSSYPAQPTLEEPAPTVPDATSVNGTISYSDLAPRLNELMASSDRISTQLVGTSTEGRDLYLVTLTAPETEAQTAQQTAWREKIRTSPEAAAADADLAAGYKTPIWFSANIHGNEWEGTDAAMQVIEDLVAAPEEEVGEMLAGHRLYFSLSLNPDGRTKATRATALSLDPNRDMITSKTPESVSFVKTAQALQALYAADFHGYTGVLQVEPCGPPHGENYEYDLFIPHGYAVARQVEDDVVAAEIPGNTYYDPATDDDTTENTGKIKIPYRDTPDGWDDFPPIFTAQYAAFHGAVTSTVELPKGRTSTPGTPFASVTTPEDAVINTAVAKQTMESMVDYVVANDDAMLANQIEMFRRGAAGAPKESLTTETVDAVEGPDEWKPLWDSVDDQDPVVLPRAYVIPVGAAQRSRSDAARVVQQLLFNGVEVGTLDRATTVDGTTYPAGSYVVDMHQPLRGMANVLLDLGSDISDKVPSMYDISAWSYSYLWGATVDKVGLTTDAPLGVTTPVTDATPTGSVPAEGQHLVLDVAGVADFQALNALLEEGVTVSMLEDGSAVVGPEDRAAAAAVAEDLGVRFTRARAADLDALDDEATKGLDDLTIAYTGTQDDKLSLLELGFDDLVPVTAAGLATDASVLADADVLWVGGALSFTEAQAPGLTALEAWLDEGHGVVGRGTAGYNAAALLGLVSATPVAGNRSGNGIVAVDTPAGSALAPYAQEASFIYPALSFASLGEGTTAEQTYAADPLLAGHWRPTAEGSPVGGPAEAAGKASVISGEAASGAKGMVFGTSVFFRTHPKGGLSQAARGLFWAAPAGEEVAPAKATSTTRLTARKAGTVKASATVRLSFNFGEAVGTVQLRERGEGVVRTVRITRADEGSKKVTVRLGRGRHVLRAVFPATEQVERSASRTVVVRLP
ncbi:M14 family zinc carboxypeptidase [Nocardioides kribbensis]|uniref:M14 family zinc carboxypeptidase n=1 Tax=Nocardioides kribbensis TaxID=305517 RepID=UPI0018798EE6|nr:M14 family zinc carboxypeptidase [Nocardioides kribbensis]